jgi:hypothetical protein
MLYNVFKYHHKNPIKDRWPKPSQGKQKGKAKERPKNAHPTRTKKKISYRLSQIGQNFTIELLIKNGIQ